MGSEFQVMPPPPQNDVLKIPTTAGRSVRQVDLKTKESRLSVGSFGQNEPETAFIEKANFALVRQTLG